MHDVRYDWLCANKNFPCLSYPGGIWLSGTTDAVVACILPFSFSLIKKALGVALVNGDWDVSGLLVTKMEIWRSSLCLGDQRLYIIPKEIFWIFELGEYVLTLLHCQCLWSFMILRVLCILLRDWLALLWRKEWMSCLVTCQVVNIILGGPDEYDNSYCQIHPASGCA